MPKSGYEQTATVYVRVDPQCKDFIKEILKLNPKMSERVFIERLIKYLMNLPPALQKDILSGERGALTSVGSVIELMAWCDHAFIKNFWEWSLEEYSDLQDFAKDAPGLQRLAHYKQSYACMGIADGLRTEAFMTLGKLLRNEPSDDSEPWDENLKAADKALYLALLHCKEFVELGGQHPVVTFNASCAFSMRGQIAVERALAEKVLAGLSVIRARKPEKKAPAGSPAIKPRKSEKSNDEDKKLTLDDLLEIFLKIADSLKDSGTTPAECWEVIGNGWRNPELMPKSERELLDDKVMAYAERAMKELRTINDPSTDTADSISQSNRGFIVRQSKIDSDLMFLRFDSKAGQDFKKWVDKYKEESRLASFNRLLSSMPEEIREMREPV